jgi:cyclic-di-AMP phosphodiesterase PgpH
MTTLLVGFLAPNSFEYIFIQIIAGSIAVISLNKMFRRGHLVITAGYLICRYLFMFVGFSLQKEGNFETINWLEFKWFALSSIFTLITYPLIYVFEKIFGFVSDVRLMELADTNNPLLRKLAEQAPGTFQHSIQVANLAEEAAIQLGANPLLIRTGALYHDVGKIEQSNYFIENQHVGQNPHNEMDYEKSAAVVIDHVSHGVNIARKYKLPELIIDFIKMHHGKGMTRFFYLKYKEENPEKQIDVEKFTYPGPNPQTLETAIVMLADSVEAAARSLPEKNEESMKRLIDQIIDSRISNHELDDAPITFRDINRIKGIFLEKLKTVYHIRIEYPKEK